MKHLTKLLTLLFVLTFATSVSAQESWLKDKSGIGPRLGYYKAPDAEEGTMFIGAQARFRGNILGAELAAEYRGKQTYSVTGGDINVSQLPVTTSLMAYLPISPNVQPYGLAGLGAYYSFYEYDGTFTEGKDSEVNLGYHLGFGLDLALSESAAFNVDYRYLYLDGDNEDIPEKEYSGNVITGGLTFYF
jgi:opacity protein-like surface antigen